MSGLFGGSDKPKTPDPMATAAAQSAANTDAARLSANLSRYNQTTPWGSLTWNDLGNDKWSSTVNLTPDGQQLLDADMRTSLGMSGLTNASLGQVGSALGSGIQQPSSNPNLQASRDYYSRNLTNPSQMVDPAIQNAMSSIGMAGDAAQRAGQVAGTEFNYSSAPGMPTANQATRQSVEDALYDRMTSRLNPQFDQSQKALESKLINQGITMGSEAWNTESQNFNQAKNDAYQSAMNEAIMGGGTEMARDFGMGMQARQQGVDEANRLRSQPFNEAGILSQLSQGDMGMAGSALGNQSSYLSNALNFGNTANQAEWADNSNLLSQQYGTRNQLLNELNALRGGSQVQQPQFQATSTGANVNPANISDNVWNAYQGQLANYNSDVNSGNSLMGGLFSLGAGALAGGYF